MSGCLEPSGASVGSWCNSSRRCPSAPPMALTSFSRCACPPPPPQQSLTNARTHAHARAHAHLRLCSRSRARFCVCPLSQPYGKNGARRGRWRFRRGGGGEKRREREGKTGNRARFAPSMCPPSPQDAGASCIWTLGSWSLIG
jgi:hypothetical protein